MKINGNITKVKKLNKNLSLLVIRDYDGKVFKYDESEQNVEPQPEPQREITDMDRLLFSSMTFQLCDDDDVVALDDKLVFNNMYTNGKYYISVGAGNISYIKEKSMTIRPFNYNVDSNGQNSYGPSMSISIESSEQDIEPNIPVKMTFSNGNPIYFDDIEEGDFIWFDAFNMTLEIVR